MKGKRDKWQVAQWDKNDKLIREVIEQKLSRGPISVSDIMKFLEAKIKEANEKAFTQFIHDHGSDKGWKPERCISRQAVHTHLKRLPNYEITKRGRGAYLSKTAGEIGKGLLDTHADDLVAWFIDQLKRYGVPDELLAKGRNLLKNYLLFLGGVYLMLEQFLKRESGSQLTLPIIIPVPETDGKVEEEQDQQPERLFNFDVPCRKVKLPTLTIRMRGRAEPLKVGGTSISGQIFQETVADISPYMFNVTITACRMEMNLRKLYEKAGKEAPGLFLYGDMLEGEGKVRLQKATSDIEKIASWWVNDISNYLPSSGMGQFMTVVSINSTRTFKRALAKIAPDYHILTKRK